ncbi:MAG: hypothetical protein FJ308_08130 [Planctomycetes bacterium]|nr:hypothetical protein [Planctomycetota bacterium]
MIPQRCGIYTRQSRESRSEFTSCDAQHNVCFVLAASIQREGWQLVDRRYDDVGQSSETLDRPALNRLIEDIKDGNIREIFENAAKGKSLAEVAQSLNEARAIPSGSREYFTPVGKQSSLPNKCLPKSRQ